MISQKQVSFSERDERKGEFRVGANSGPMRWTLLIALCLTTIAWAAPDGKALYTENCASCHGAKGLGDGPNGALFDTKPTNLASASHYKRGSSDKAVLKSISNGIPGGPMEGYGKKLGEANCKALVAYLKTLRGDK